MNVPWEKGAKQPNIDWEPIKAEYVTTNISKRKLAEKHGEEEAGRLFEKTGAVIRPLPDAKHIFTHREWHMKAWQVTLPEDSGTPEFLGMMLPLWLGSMALIALFLLFIFRKDPHGRAEYAATDRHLTKARTDAYAERAQHTRKRRGGARRRLEKVRYGS